MLQAPFTGTPPVLQSDASVKVTVFTPATLQVTGTNATTPGPKAVIGGVMSMTLNLHVAELMAQNVAFGAAAPTVHSVPHSNTSLPIVAAALATLLAPGSIRTDKAHGSPIGQLRLSMRSLGAPLFAWAQVSVTSSHESFVQAFASLQSRA